VTNQPLAREIEGQLRELAGVPGRALEKTAEKAAPVSSKEDKPNEKRPHKVGV